MFLATNRVQLWDRLFQLLTYPASCPSSLEQNQCGQECINFFASLQALAGNCDPRSGLPRFWHLCVVSYDLGFESCSDPLAKLVLIKKR